MDLGHLGSVRNRLTVARNAGPVGVDHHRIAKDYSDCLFVSTDGDGLPCFISPELRELQRTAAATEAMYLFARYVFEDLGYRRYEWKCNALNEPSRRAAERLGFTFEGIFRQHMIMKGRNRDTAWFSMLDSEWPARKAEFERWLDPANFDNGKQRSPLRMLLR